MSLRLLRLRPLRVLPLLVLLSGCTPQIGKKCTLSTDCSQLGDRLCDTTQPDGYCTVFNCEPDMCPNAICVAFNPVLDPACGVATDGRWPRFERSFCLASCNGNGDCRDQYQCIDLSLSQNQTARRAFVVDQGAADGGLGFKVCMPATCGDGIQDAAETDVDCGGPVCPLCNARKRCSGGGDCLSGNCPAGVCVEKHCLDGMKDSPPCMTSGPCGPSPGDETDVDCGGSDCTPCSTGQACKLDDDCLSHFCDPMNSTCTAGDCTNGKLDGDETDVDCGGHCQPCGVGQGCAQDLDCATATCSSSNHCILPPPPPICFASDAGFDGSIPWTPYNPDAGADGG